MSGERIDLNTKEIWNIEKAGLIADHFGYVCNDNFKRALEEFKKEIVDSAKIDLFLSVVAQNFFTKFQPPLERKNQK
jgi:hypothetical protein